MDDTSIPSPVPAIPGMLGADGAPTPIPPGEPPSMTPALERADARVRRVSSVIRGAIADMLDEAGEDPRAFLTTLERIGSVAHEARNVINAVGGPSLHRPRRGKHGGNSNYGGNVAYSGSSYTDGGDDFEGNMNPETFGARILQEVLADLPRMAATFQAPALIQSIDSARHAGLTDVADMLEKQLRGSLNLLAVAPTLPATEKPPVLVVESSRIALGPGYDILAAMPPPPPLPPDYTMTTREDA